MGAHRDRLLHRRGSGAVHPAGTWPVVLVVVTRPCMPQETVGFEVIRVGMGVMEVLGVGLAVTWWRMVWTVLKRAHFHHPPEQERSEHADPEGPVARPETRATADSAKTLGEGCGEIVHDSGTKDLITGLIGQPSSLLRNPGHRTNVQRTFRLEAFAHA